MVAAQPVGLLILILKLFHMIYVEGRELYLVACKKIYP